MYYSELIHDFLEGTLDKTQQDIFFIALTNNEDFRQELIESIRIDRSFSSRLSQMAPSAASTYTVFSKLGFNPPSSVPVPQKVPFYKKYMQGIVASFVSVLITSFVFGLYILNDNKDNSQYSSNANNIIYPLMKSLEINPYQMPQAGDLKSNIPDNSGLTLIHEQTRQHNMENKDDKELIAINNNESDILEFEGISKSNISISNEINNPGFEHMDNSYTDGFQNMDMDDSFTSEFKGWGLEIKGGYYMRGGVEQNGINQAENFRNIGIGLTYKATDNLKLLLTVSNQNFDKTYERIDPYNNNLEKYIVNPSFINVSAGIKYNFLNIDNSSLFVQGSIGAFPDFSCGTGSLQIGLEYNLTPEYSIILNGEMMVLGFEHQGETLLVPKTGINIGVGLNL